MTIQTLQTFANSEARLRTQFDLALQKIAQLGRRNQHFPCKLLEEKIERFIETVDRLAQGQAALDHIEWNEAMEVMMNRRYTLTEEKAEAIAALSGRTILEVLDYCCNQDWPEGQEHQDWLNRASPEEIADWIQDTETIE